jgi:hypothetical protein
MKNRFAFDDEFIFIDLETEQPQRFTSREVFGRRKFGPESTKIATGDYKKVLASTLHLCPVYPFRKGENERNGKKRTNPFNIIEGICRQYTNLPYEEFYKKIVDRKLEDKLWSYIPYKIEKRDGKIYGSYKRKNGKTSILWELNNSYYIDPDDNLLKYVPPQEIKKKKKTEYKRIIDGKNYWRIKGIWYEVQPKEFKYSEYIKDRRVIDKLLKRDMADWDNWKREYAAKKRQLNTKEKKKLGLI